MLQAGFIRVMPSGANSLCCTYDAYDMPLTASITCLARPYP
jgi:hypothetical protein